MEILQDDNDMILTAGTEDNLVFNNPPSTSQMPSSTNLWCSFYEDFHFVQLKPLAIPLGWSSLIWCQHRWWCLLEAVEDDQADDKKCAGHVQRLENPLHWKSLGFYFFHRSGRCWKREGFLFGRHVPWSSLAELQFWRLVWVSLADWHSFERLQQLPSLCRNWFVNTCTYFSFKVY